MRKISGHGLWLMAAAAILALTVAALFAPQAANAGLHGRGPIVDIDGQRQIFRDDVIVHGDIVIDDDVIVYDGDVQVESGGEILGDLVVYSGDVEIEEGANVAGDVSAFSGDIEIAGTVGGDIASWSGDVDLAESATVVGDISVLSGEIDLENGATVHGNLVEGPSFNLPLPKAGSFSFRTTPGEEIIPAVQGAKSTQSFVQWLASILLRLILAVVATVAVALLGSLLVSMRPEFVESVKSTLLTETALSFAVGLMANLVLLFLVGILTITICLAPLALVPILIILTLNLAGWTALASEVGRRLVDYSRAPVQPAVSTGLGLLVITSVPALLWAFGGCFRFMGLVALLLIASAGTGAVIVPWLRRGKSTNFDTQQGSAAEEAPVESSTGDMTSETTGETAGEEASPDSSTQSADQPETPAEPDAALVDKEMFEDDSTAVAESPSGPEAEPEPAPSDEVVSPPASPSLEDDFTRIAGIGPAFDRRLKAANIRTFTDLASLSSEDLADILGWTTERIEREDLLGQATRLAADTG